MTNTTTRQGVVLSGGGAYAAYEVGVLKALTAGKAGSLAGEPFDPHILSGTSAGAFNAALLLSVEAREFDAAVRYLEQTWRDDVAAPSEAGGGGVLRYRGLELLPLSLGRSVSLPMRAKELVDDSIFFAGDWFRRLTAFVQTTGSIEPRLIELIDVGSAISTHPMQQLIERTVNLTAVRASHRHLAIAVTNWRTGDLRVFKNAELTDACGHHAVLASAAIPMVFDPVEIEGDPYVDGGVVMQTPLKLAIDASGETLHVILMDPAVNEIPFPPVSNTIDSVYRMMVSTMAATFNRDVADASEVNRHIHAGRHQPAHRLLTIHRHQPRRPLGRLSGMLDFSLEHVDELIARGYEDTSAHNCEINECVRP